MLSVIFVGLSDSSLSYSNCVMVTIVVLFNLSIREKQTRVRLKLCGLTWTLN
jgi:hypothetical protein